MIKLFSLFELTGCFWTQYRTTVNNRSKLGCSWKGKKQPKDNRNKTITPLIISVLKTGCSRLFRLFTVLAYRGQEHLYLLKMLDLALKSCDRVKQPSFIKSKNPSLASGQATPGRELSKQ